MAATVIMTQERGRRKGWRDSSQEEAAPLTPSAAEPPPESIRQPAAAESVSLRAKSLLQVLPAQTQRLHGATRNL